jgi:hypothetical protein
MKDLKLMDKRLNCHFDSDIERFVVTYQRPYGDPAIVHLIKTDDGGFRQPNRFDLEFIRGGDMENMTVRERMNHVSYYMEKVREKNRRDAKDNIRHMTLDGRRQLKAAFDQIHGAGKGNATFRRITPKPKGKVFSNNMFQQ